MLEEEIGEITGKMKEFLRIFGINYKLSAEHILSL